MPPVANDLIDLEKTLARFENDRELLREVVFVFIAETPERSRKIARAFAAHDLEQLVRLAHSLKGVCGTMHAEPLREICYRVEMAARAGDAKVVDDLVPRLLATLEALTEYLSDEFRNGRVGA
ncbi:Hpt domain-containing protein [Desulfolutivibrio sulfoxidireducens]|uniref:Hpt domain-containing protein n=1 Tax=Desulfolutivibrio sulfoxidireducens TaxID=2773299 RepID=UPI00159D563E|nr:Hpt domain-containing protein [Desulfolutivibrio sulfoxidireducens]QLA20347.1 Hpt domain-containing protein [Desulfolutivibrio sulfoxidireducens]